MGNGPARPLFIANPASLAKAKTPVRLAQSGSRISVHIDPQGQGIVALQIDLAIDIETQIEKTRVIVYGDSFNPGCGRIRAAGDLSSGYPLPIAELAIYPDDVGLALTGIDRPAGCIGIRYQGKTTDT